MCKKPWNLLIFELSRQLNYTHQFHPPVATCWLAGIVKGFDQATLFVSHWWSQDCVPECLWDLDKTNLKCLFGEALLNSCIHCSIKHLQLSRVHSEFRLTATHPCNSSIALKRGKHQLPLPLQDTRTAISLHLSTKLKSYSDEQNYAAVGSLSDPSLPLQTGNIKLYQLNSCCCLGVNVYNNAS